MPESRTVVVAIRLEPVRTWFAAALQSSGAALARAGSWCAATASEAGNLVSAFMGPAVVSAYAFALWSLAANLNWTDTFVFNSGPFSNWLVWIFLAGSLNGAAVLLKRKVQVPSRTSE